MATSPEPEDWEATIHTTTPRWTYDVLEKCKGFNYPAEFFEAVAIEWHDTRGPSDLQDDIEKEYYRIPNWGFAERIELMQHPHDFITSKDNINEFVNCIKEMRETDEQLVRLAKEVKLWSDFAIDMAGELTHERWKLGQLKAKLEAVAGQLRAALEEEMADFVWPEENRREDSDTERRARERRDKALEKEKK